jgi:GNAT superfamily N-acetyltransferase
MGGMETSAEAAVLAPVIRRLAPQDEGELRRVLLRLEPSARCSRFGQAASDGYLAKHAKCALANADSIMGAFIGERLRGFAEIYNGRPHGFSDTAFVVEPEWRRRGLGWANAPGCDAGSRRVPDEYQSEPGDIEMASG